MARLRDALGGIRQLRLNQRLCAFLQLIESSHALQSCSKVLVTCRRRFPGLGSKSLKD